VGRGVQRGGGSLKEKPSLRDRLFFSSEFSASLPAGLLPQARARRAGVGTAKGSGAGGTGFPSVGIPEAEPSTTAAHAQAQAQAQAEGHSQAKGAPSASPLSLLRRLTSLPVGALTAKSHQQADTTGTARRRTGGAHA